MAQPKPSPGNAHEKRNSWVRGNGNYSYRDELRHNKIDMNNADYKKLVKTVNMINFT